MRVLILTPYQYGSAPGPRTSIEQWEAPLASAGITFEYAPFESERLHDILYAPGHTAAKAAEMVRGLVRRLPLMKRLSEFDAVLVYREAALLGPAFLERWVAHTRTPIIYQLDDPLYVPYRSPANGYLSYLKCFGKVKSIIKLSKVVIVNSPQHRDFAAPFTDNLWEIPSVVDETTFNVVPRAPPNGRQVCVGWSGSASTVANLQVIRGVLGSVGDRSDVRLRFIGGTDFDLPGVDHVAVPWRAETEVEDLRQFDLGLVPLPTTAWTRRKFYVKLIQYMALGIPPIASPLGANPYVIDHGRNGFLASTTAEWQDTIGKLIAHPDLRAEVGAAAAADARAKYTVSANAEKIVAAFRSAVA